MTIELKFKIAGMDSAPCIKKIETVVKRVRGVSDVEVSLDDQTLSVQLSDISMKEEIEKVVKDVGYIATYVNQRDRPEIENDGPAIVASYHRDFSENGLTHSAQSPDHPLGECLGSQRKRMFEDQSQMGHWGSDHALTIESGWWNSSQGRRVIFLATLIVAAFGYSRLLLPYGGQLLFTVACVTGAIPLLRRASYEIRSGSLLTIEMLTIIVVIGAMIIGAIEAAALVVFLFAVGELLKGYAVGRVHAGIDALSTLAPKTALVETADEIVETPLEKVHIGETIVVMPGNRIPADGTIISGSSTVDESVFRSLSMSRYKRVGDLVLAGSINIEAALRCRVEKIAEETFISRLRKLIENASDMKATNESRIDKPLRYYTIAICVLALAVALVSPLLMAEPWIDGLYKTLPLLLIACPCALVISTPASIASALAAGIRRGLLVKDGSVLEAIGKVKAIVFDRTGTLTAGKPKVTDIVTLSNMDERTILSMAASAEAASSHPVGVGIVNYARQQKVTFTPASNWEVISGKGIRATVDSCNLTISAPRRLGFQSADLLAKTEALEKQGKSVFVLQIERKSVGLIALRDEPRPDAADALSQIKGLGIKPIILTADNRSNAEALGALLGAEVKAELMPEDKLRHIRLLAGRGSIAKVGIDDAPAFAAATIGIAMGAGTGIAIEAADAAVPTNRIADIVRLVKLSRRLRNIIRQNLVFTLGLKIAFLPATILGATGLWTAILADTGVTVLVAANALRLLQK